MAESVSAGTVSNVLERAQAAGLSWPLPSGLDDDGLRTQLYPPAPRESEYGQPDWNGVLRELRAKRKRRRVRARRRTLWEESQALHEMMGVDLNTIPTIGVNTALVIASEIGPDFSAIPTVQHFCSSLGLAPGTRIRDGKSLPGRAHKVVNPVAQALRIAAMTARTSQTLIGAPRAS